MKKLPWILFLMSAWSFSGFAQTPKEGVEHASFSPIDIFNTQQASTGIVIIDDDELGVTIAPNPANNFITVTSTKDLSNKTFSLIDNTGITVLKRQLASTGNTFDVSIFSSGSYYCTISDSQNKKLYSGSLIIQH